MILHLQWRKLNYYIFILFQFSLLYLCIKHICEPLVIKSEMMRWVGNVRILVRKCEGKIALERLRH